MLAPLAEEARSKMDQRVIDISGLSLNFVTADGPVQALSAIDLVVERGDRKSVV